MKNNYAITLIILTAVLSVMTGCRNGAKDEAPVVQSTEVIAEVVPNTNNTEEKKDILGRYVIGIDDRAILEGAESIDYLIRAERMKRVVTKIDVDDSAVDTTKPGTYKVRYTVTVDVKNLEKAEAYIAVHPEALEAAPVPTIEAEPSDKEDEHAQPTGEDAGQPQEPSAGSVLPNIPDEVFEAFASSESGNPAETAEIVIDKDVTVVTSEEAIEIISRGGVVWTDGSTPATVESITGGESSQAGTTKPAVVVETTADKDKDRNTDQSQARSGQSDDDEHETSDPESHSSPPSGGENEISHAHNWIERTETVYHDEVGHYETVQIGTETVVDEEAWDEPVYDMLAICNACGYTSDSTEDINNHLYDHYDPELGYVDASYGVAEVQIDTIHHPARTHAEPIYEDRWVVDSEAWSEEKIIGYYCSECGAER